MKKLLAFGVFGCMLMCFVFINTNCSIVNDSDSDISGTSIDRMVVDHYVDIPFENAEVLKSFADDSQIINYNTARKLALIEFLAAGYDNDMDWVGYKFNPLPVVIYGFDNKPKFYDFIVLDAEEQPVGTITVHARRASTTSIRSISSGVKDYREALSKAGFQASFYEDWRGNSYLGLRGKSGDTPDAVINITTGENAVGITELEGTDIISALLQDNFYMQIVSENNGSSFGSETDIEMALQNVFAKQAQNVEEFWSIINELLPEIESIGDEDEIIDSSGKFIVAFITRILYSVVSSILGVDTNRYFIEDYTSYTTNYNPVSGAWCGPWAVAYLQWINSGRTSNTYNKALDYTSWLLGKIFGGEPMTPSDFNRALQHVSNNTMYITTNKDVFDQISVYSRIKNDRKPVAVVSEPPIGKKVLEVGVHWYIAVGARAVNNWSFHFLLQENHNNGDNRINTRASLINNNRRDDNTSYRELPIWSIWYNVNN